MTKKKEDVQHCKEFAPTLDEMTLLIEGTPTLQLKVAQILLFSNLRVGEVAHAQSSWMHIGDKQAIHESANYIDIPKPGQVCDCWDCLLQGYLEIQQDLNEGKHPTKWFQEEQKKFYKLKRSFKRHIKNTIKKEKKAGKHIEHSKSWLKRKLHAFLTDKGLDKLNKYQWQPKTDSGKRWVWLLNDEHSNLIKEFFDENTTIGLSRRQIYEKIKSLGHKILKKKVFPHSERSTSAIRISYSGASEATVNNQMGWKTNLAKDYVKSDSKLALVDLKNKMKT